MADSVNQSKSNPVISTQRYLKIAEIHDNTIVLKDGNVRAVLQTTSVNFNLKSEDEQNAIIYSYQSFINSLSFPIQILVKSKKLDIDRYLETLKKIAEKQKNQLLQRQTFEYLEYIRRLVEYADIMEKKFYVIVPYDRTVTTLKQNIFKQFWANINPEDSAMKAKDRRKEFDNLHKGLLQRVGEIKGSLENMGLKAEQLTTSQLIELFYSTYNPLLARNQKLDNLDQFKMIQWEPPATSTSSTPPPPSATA